MAANGRIIVVGDYMDDIVAIPSGPIRRDTDTAASITQTGGGSASNLACWLATLIGRDSQVSHLASTSVSVDSTSVGPNSNSRVQVELHARVAAADVARVSAQLSAFGVTPRLQPDASLPTGALVVLVDGEARTMLTQRGANDALDAAAILESIKAPEPLAWLHLSGYSLLAAVSSSASQGLIAAAHQRGAPVSIDPGSAGFIEELTPQRFLDAVAGADILFPNRDEAQLLASVGELVDQFPLVLEKHGAKGGVAHRLGHPDLSWQPAPLLGSGDHLPVDPTGAGDAFAAGFIAACLARGISRHLLVSAPNVAPNTTSNATPNASPEAAPVHLAELLEVAAAVASRAVSVVGARPVLKT